MQLANDSPEMEAAPKEGWFLAWNQYDDRWQTIRRAADFTYRWQDELQRYRFDTFTHWIPLPAPPTSHPHPEAECPKPQSESSPAKL